MAEALFWPALLGYGEAAFAYASARTSRAATWGVRVGWLAQTALLVVAGGARRRLPVVDLGRLAQPVRLARRRRVPDLGLPAALPAARPRGDAARGRCSSSSRGSAAAPERARSSSYGNLFLVLHVGFVLAAFAGFTLAAALAGLYLWEERRLKRRAADILRLRLPPLASLERLTWRTIAVSLPLLTLGLVAGIVRQRAARRRGRRARGGDASLTWLVYGGFLVASPGRPPRRVLRARRLRARDRRAARARGEPLRMTLTLGRPLAPRRAGRAARARRARRSTRAAALARSLGDAVCLSTCNRTELYVAGDDEARALAALEQLAGEPLDGRRLPAARRRGRAAPVPRRRRARLARPGRGRDPRPGARGLRGGRRRARCSTASSGRRSRVGKRVRTETAIGESPASVSSAAAALAAQVFGDLAGRRVLLIGAGRIGELAASNLASRGAEIAFVANRTLETARSSRTGSAAQALALDDARGRVSARSTSSSPRPARPAPSLHAADVPAQRRTPLFFIDIAVPRDLDPAIAQARRLLPLRHRRSRGRRRGDARRPPRRGRARRAARRRGGRALPRVARVARRRPGDRVAARAGRGDPQSPSSRSSRAASPTTSGARSSR